MKFAVLVFIHVCTCMYICSYFFQIQIPQFIHAKNVPRVPYRDYDALLLEPCPVDNEMSSQELSRKRCRPSSSAIVSYPTVLQVKCSSVCTCSIA